VLGTFPRKTEYLRGSGENAPCTMTGGRRWRCRALPCEAESTCVENYRVLIPAVSLAIGFRNRPTRGTPWTGTIEAEVSALGLKGRCMAVSENGRYAEGSDHFSGSRLRTDDSGMWRCPRPRAVRRQPAGRAAAERGAGRPAPAACRRRALQTARSWWPPFEYRSRPTQARSTSPFTPTAVPSEP